MANPQMHELAMRHVAAEAAEDLDGTMATLEGEPVYDLFPVGRRMVGREAVRRYYAHFFANVKPRLGDGGGEMHGLWTGDNATVMEYTLAYRHDDGHVTRHRVIGILPYGQTGLAGERLYADEEILRLMFAPLWDEMANIEA